MACGITESMREIAGRAKKGDARPYKVVLADNRYVISCNSGSRIKGVGIRC